MSQEPSDPSRQMNRRTFMAVGGSVVAAAATTGMVNAAPPAISTPSPAPFDSPVVPFYGPRQGGILTPAQSHTYLTTFDITTHQRQQMIDLLQAWTTAAARMTVGQPAEPLPKDPAIPATDSGETLELSPARLTITFGFGPGLFIKDGKDRFGLAAQRPEAFVDLPRFAGDQLVETQTGGDLCIQACADDPQVAFHAVRQLARLAYDSAQLRWAQSGFIASFGPKKTPRNLMGFKDGTANPSPDDPKLMNQFVWVGDEGPQWMRGGSYVVFRRSRIALEHWDRMNVAFQEQAIGRKKYSGAGLGSVQELDPVDLDANDKDGNPVIPENSHVRLAMPASNDGARILRRSYSYNDGLNFTSERWPPWRQGMEYDAGLLFCAYQRDLRTGFIKIFDQMSKSDMLNQFVTHTGGGAFACPPGVAPGEYIGQRLFTTPGT